jgi:hypothetical protein
MLYLKMNLECRLVSINSIGGVLDHSAACTATVEITRDPPIPLHPEIRDYALLLLADCIPLTQIQHLAKKHAISKWGNEMGTTSFRYRLTTHDSTSLYRSNARTHGITQQTSAEENLHNWFRADKPLPPDPAINDAVLYYEPQRANVPDSRFVLILAAPIMRERAWQFAHGGQLLADITFGFSSAQANLLILMTIDDRYKGVPIAYILFTVHADTKAVHADYDTVLMEKLIGLYVKGLGTNSRGKQFCPSITVTNYDKCKRRALVMHFPNVTLLICLFHIWQA